MNLLLDMIVLALIIGTVTYYTKRGFLKSVLGFGRTLLAFLLARIFGPKLGELIADKALGNIIAEKIYTIFTSLFDDAVESFDLSTLFQQAPDTFVDLVERFGGSMSTLEMQYGDMTAATRENLMELSQSIATPITTSLSNVIGYFLVFFLVFLLLWACSGLITKIFELPILTQVNHILGFFLGILFAVIYVLLFCFLVTVLLRFAGAVTGSFIADTWIDQSYLFKLVVGINIF